MRREAAAYCANSNRYSKVSSYCEINVARHMYVVEPTGATNNDRTKMEQPDSARHSSTICSWSLVARGAPWGATTSKAHSFRPTKRDHSIDAGRPEGPPPKRGASSIESTEARTIKKQKRRRAGDAVTPRGQRRPAMSASTERQVDGVESSCGTDCARRDTK